jgi:hypothetical protein
MTDRAGAAVAEGAAYGAAGAAVAAACSAEFAHGVFEVAGLGVVA